MTKLSTCRQSIVTMMLLCISVLVTAQTIRIDGNFSDWDDLSPVFIDEVGDGQSNGIDFERVWITNDQSYIYVRFELNREIDLQENNELALYLDMDDNLNTGFKINGIGAEVRYLFGDRTAILTKDGDTEFVNFIPIGLLAGPTVTGTEFEVSISRSINDSGINIVAGDVISLRLEDNSFSGDEAPSQLTGIDYIIDESSVTTLPPVILARQPDTPLRLLTYNIEQDQLFDPSRRDNFRRIFQSIDPDIIALQEVRDFNSAETRDLIEDFLPGTWFHKKHGFDIVTLSRFPFNFTENINGNAAFYIDVEGQEVLLINCHLPCCDNDIGRQEEVDQVMQYIREAADGNEAYPLTAGTPIIIAGDMNFVGDRDQPYTMRTGDIRNNGSFGPDFAPDWDGTDLADADGTATGTISNFTWLNPFGSFLAGKLDWIYYTDSNLELRTSFALWTAAMNGLELAQSNLLSGDVISAADHLPTVADFSFKPVSVKEFITFDVEIYPHPVVDRCYLSTEETLIGDIHIFTVEGVKVATIATDGSRIQTIDTSALSPGMYYIMMESQKGSMVRSLVKQ